MATQTMQKTARKVTRKQFIANYTANAEQALKSSNLTRDPLLQMLLIDQANIYQLLADHAAKMTTSEYVVWREANSRVLFGE